MFCMDFCFLMARTLTSFTIPLREDKLFSDMWASLWLQMEGVDCICPGQLLSFLFLSFSLTYQLKCPKHLPASFVFPLFPTVFFFSKVKHRSFCFMLHQLSGLPPFTSYHQLEQMEKNTFAKMGLTQAAHPCWLSGYPLQGRQCEFL